MGNTSAVRRQHRSEVAEATLLSLLERACQEAAGDGPVIVYAEQGIPLHWLRNAAALFARPLSFRPYLDISLLPRSATIITFRALWGEKHPR